MAWKETLPDGEPCALFAEGVPGAGDSWTNPNEGVFGNMGCSLLRRQLPRPGPFFGIAAGGGFMLVSSSLSMFLIPIPEDRCPRLIAWKPLAGGEGERVWSLPAYLSPWPSWLYAEPVE